jgi:hypothetical protein
MPSKRQILDLLTRGELQDIADAYQLEVADRRAKDQLVDAAAVSRKVVLADVLALYSRDRLKDLCSTLGLDESGKEKAILVERVISGSVQAKRSRNGERGSARRAIQTPQQLRRIISRLSPASPITDSFSAKWRRREGGQQERSDVWYTTQRRHWLGWLGEWDGPGAYGRKNSKRSAQFVYDHIVNPQMLVYLAEAAGIPGHVVKKAATTALAGRSMAAMSAAIRRVIPWENVEEALLRC